MSEISLTDTTQVDSSDFLTLSFEAPKLRRYSFVDLTSDPEGIPDLPGLEQLPTDISDFSYSTPIQVQIESIELTLNYCMPAAVVKTHRDFSMSISPQLRCNAVGILTKEQRSAKVQRYLEKRRKRKWTKRISYVCRKRVADKRLRIKGRFVTKEQAISILGIEEMKENSIQRA